MVLYLMWHSRATCLLSHGVAWGLVWGGFAWLWPATPGVALTVGILGGLVFGLLYTQRRWRKWPTADRLAPADRVAVARAVRSGEAISQPHLVPPTIELATLVRESTLRGVERLDQYRWFDRILAGLCVLIGVRASSGHSDTPHPVIVWAMAARWGWMGTLQPRYLLRVASNADRALAAATAGSPTFSLR